MTIEDTFRRVDRYLASDKHSTIFVDVPNAKVLNAFRDHYKVGQNVIKSAADFASEDNLPNMSSLIAYLQNSDDTIFLDGLTFYLHLEGRETLTKGIKSLLDIVSNGKVIIIAYGCDNVLKSLDKRLFQSARISIIDGAPQGLPRLQFTGKMIPEPEAAIPGINKLAAIDLYLHDGYEEAAVVTDKSKTDFPESDYEVTELNSSYGAVLCMFPELQNIGENAGTKDQWNWLLHEATDSNSWNDYVFSQFGTITNLASQAKRLKDLDKGHQWLYFLALRTFGAKGSNYLSQVVTKSTTFNEFVSNSFCHILSIEAKSDASYWSSYEERKALVEGLQQYSDADSEFCKQVHQKGEKSLYYMTDLSTMEKEKTIELIAQYYAFYTYDRLVAILQKTYPDLSSYLTTFDLDNKDLNEYINEYKYCKLTNHITDDLRAKVEKQATEHQFITWLRPRSEVVDKLKKDSKSSLYFMDAMGVEFLGFMQQKCFANGLTLQATAARCELPSITKVNKEFVEEFKMAGCKVYDNKELDELKHNGNSTYNYENNKLPIHIVEELNILNRLISQLKTMDKDETAYVIADHGATRLAVINETENKWEVAEKGLHSGRCCPKSDIDDKPDFAIEDNEFWSLANYDRFKGGRKALVEVHGGATIEEVTVPIITIQKMDQHVTCILVTEEAITVSFKKKAELLLFVDIDSKALSIVVNNNRYEAVSTGVDYQYKVVMPDIKKAGTYQFDVYNNGALICKGLNFEVKKEGASEKKFF